MIIVVTLLCILSLHTSQCASYRYTNTSCLETYKLNKTNKDKITCTGEHVVNHCIPDDQHKEMEVCVQWKWITPGYCPYYDKFSDAIKEEGCTSYCLWNEDLFDVCKCSSTFNKNSSCKKKCEDAFGSYKYIFCEHENVPHLDTTTVNGTLGGYDTTHSQESQTNDGTIWIIIGITVSVVVLLAIIIAVIIAVVAVRRRIKKRRHSRGNRRAADDDINSQDENNQNLLCTENGDNETQEMMTFIEENQRERNNNGNVDVEMHVPSVTDQSSNQTVKDDSNDEKKQIQTHADDSSGDENAELEDVVVDNTLRESDNGGGSSNNVTMKHVDEQEHQSNIADTHLNSSADSGNEDTSKDNIVTEGIFVDSLASITKEDDEEGGWSELQDLLEYMCTVPARKLLYNVVKEYVDNPDNYFKDESKKALFKSALPQEFHSALDHESEYRHSIPVMYAILQVSLSEKQPNSGWGQKVKDTDTGVGDDVERVYQAHTLSREINNPEKISVDGYVRLFEMLIGAVERLDIKGKCSEDYREIVRRWENIQRKLWMKDKWKTFTNFIKKLS